MKRLILYDLDGTLVNTEQDIADAVNVMLTTMHAPPLPTSQIRAFVGRGLDDLVRQTLRTEDPARIQEGIERFGAHYARHLADTSRPYPYAIELLDYFRGRPQVILTNKPGRFSHELLRALGLSGYFSAVIAGDSGYPKKPHPAGIQALLRSYEVPPQDALLIGDSLVDIRTGRNADVPTVVIGHGFTDRAELERAVPDLLVQNFQELLDLIRARGW